MIKMEVPVTYSKSVIAHIKDENFYEKVKEYINQFILRKRRVSKWGDKCDLEINLSPKNIFPLPLSWFLYWINQYHLEKSIMAWDIHFDGVNKSIFIRDGKFAYPSSLKNCNFEKENSLKYWEELINKKKILLKVNDFFAREDSIIDHTLLVNDLYNKSLEGLNLGGIASGKLLKSDMILKDDQISHIEIKIKYRYHDPDLICLSDDISNLIRNKSIFEQQISNNCRGINIEVDNYVITVANNVDIRYDIHINDKITKVSLNIIFKVIIRQT